MSHSLNSLLGTPGLALAPLAWIAGAAAVVLYCVARVGLGLRLSLYFVNEDTAIRDQSLIPVTFSARKRSWVRCLRERKWKDDVELTLMDYQSRAFRFRVTYGLWGRYSIEFKDGPEGAKLGRRVLQPGRLYRLRSGMRLVSGGRRFEVRVLPNRPELTLQF